MSADPRRAAVIAAYRAGATVREIVAMMRPMAPRTVRRWVAQVQPLRRLGPRGRVDVPSELIVELRDVDHLSYAQIAAEVGMSQTGVRHRYHLATKGYRPDRRPA